MGKLFSWLAKCVGSRPDSLFEDHNVDELELAMRKSWTFASAHLKMVYAKGTSLNEDEIKGEFEGFRVAVTNETDFDIQRLVTVVRVFSNGVLAPTLNLYTKELMTAYEEAVQNCGAVPEGLLSDEAKAWFQGHRYGGGTKIVNGDLIFQAAFCVDDSTGITLVAKAMVLTIRQLAYRRSRTLPTSLS